MGFRFRKSIKIGPARINLSKSGIGYSVGTKGARITKPAKGKTRATISAPGTGLSYSKTISGKKKKAAPAKSHEKKSSATRVESRAQNKFTIDSGAASFQKSWVMAIIMAVIGFGIVWFVSLICLLIIDVIVGIFNYDAATGTFAIIVLVLVPILLGITSAVFAFRYAKPDKAEKQVDKNAEPKASAEPEITSTPTATDPSKTAKPDTEVKVYQVAGVSHYLDTLMSMAEPNYLYSYKKQELIDTCHYEETIYKQTVNASHLDLTHEPDNPYDPNAIKVLLNGNLVGYIAADDCQHILETMSNGLFVSATCEVTGGRYKRVDEDYDVMKDKSTYKMETGEDPYKITIYIREKVLP